MKKTTKGALSAAAAGTLLLGGAGSYAFWTASTNVSGTALAAGHLKIADQTCSSAVWKLDGGATYTTQKLVPGDSLTKTCTFKIDGIGDHMGVTLDTATPAWDTANSDGALTNELAVTADFTGSVHGALASGATVNKDEVITVDLKVDFDGAGATDASNGDFSAVLNQITLTAHQNHA